MNIEQHRPAFGAALNAHAEEAGHEDMGDLTRDGDGYADPATPAAWWGWGMSHSKTFEITYRCPDSGEIKTIERDFDDSEEFPARMWADDLGYGLADKGWYEIKERK